MIAQPSWCMRSTWCEQKKNTIQPQPQNIPNKLLQIQDMKLFLST